MPSIRLTDANVAKLPLGPVTWYSDEQRRYPGLRLCVSRSARTFFLSKRDPHVGKVVSIKLGRFPDLSVHAAWKKAEAEASRVDNGTARAEALPTLRAMLERYIARRIRAGKLSEETARDYWSTARHHFAPWLNLPLDRIKAVDVVDRLEALKAAKPYQATKAAAILGAVYRLAQDLDFDVRIPTRAFDRAPAKPREVDTSIPWSQRRAEIEAVPNMVHRVAWHLLWHTGIRSGNLRSLTWDDVNLDARTVHLARMKNRQSRTLPLSDVSVGLFKRLVGLHPRWVFPAARGDGHIDALDRLQSQSQHVMRHLWVDAAAACHLPSYIIAFLKGDVIRADGQQMVAHYMHDLGDHAAPNAISAKIEAKCVDQPDA